MSKKQVAALAGAAVTVGLIVKRLRDAERDYEQYELTGDPVYLAKAAGAGFFAWLAIVSLF